MGSDDQVTEGVNPNNQYFLIEHASPNVRWADEADLWCTPSNVSLGQRRIARRYYAQDNPPRAIGNAGRPGKRGTKLLCRCSRAWLSSET